MCGRAPGLLCSDLCDDGNGYGDGRGVQRDGKLPSPHSSLPHSGQAACHLKRPRLPSSIALPLSTTTSPAIPQDVVLNSVAIGFIFDIDEMFYDFVSRAERKTYQARLAPPPYHTRSQSFHMTLLL